jgi:hypothetical protein
VASLDQFLVQIQQRDRIIDQLLRIYEDDHETMNNLVRFLVFGADSETLPVRLVLHQREVMSLLQELNAHA